MIRAALYIRVSTEEQVLHGLSIDAQKDALEKYAKEENMQIVGFYIDEGVTARKKYTHRKEFTRLIEDVKQSKIDTIIFTKLDRWFRNISEYYKVQDILDKYKVNWKTIFENYDTSTASGRLHINIMLSVAQDEADRTGERIKSVFKHKIDNGEYLNGSAPYGYDLVDGKLVVNQEQALRVKEIFNTYELNRSISATQKWYIETYEVKVSYEFISRMIKREIYIGKYKHNDRFCEPIILTDQYARINKEKGISFSRLGNTGMKYFFSGLAECNTCGRKMNGVVCYNPKPTKYYSCRHGAHFTTCTHNKRCRESKIENVALDEILKHVNTRVSSVEIKKKKPKNSEKDIINKKLKKIKELYVADLIQIDEYRKDYELYLSQLKELENEEAENDVSYDFLDLATYIKNTDFRLMYEKMDDEHKRLFWYKTISKITITDNNEIRIIFRF